MQDLRRIPFFIAVALLVLTVSAELGGALVKDSAGGLTSVCGGLMDDDLLDELDIDLDDHGDACDDANDLKSDVKGLGVPYLAMIDGVWLFNIIFMAVALFIDEALTGKLQGIITLIFSVILLVADIALIFTALTKLLTMVSLFLAVPFGTIAYFAIYASFPRGPMLGLLSAIMLLKIGVVIALIIGQQRFLQNKKLVLLILSSFLAGVIVSFLLGIVPGFLASITDALAAIVVGIIGAVWLVILLVGSIPAIIKAVT